MPSILVYEAGKTHTLEVEEGASVVAALRSNGFVVDAPCGGAGTCKKCSMLISDAQGVSYRLACQTKVSEGLEVTIEHSHEMSVEMGSGLTRWQPDGDAGTYGLAIDVGTTTLVMRLHDLRTGEALGAIGRSNPQLAYGADVISRISACAGGSLDAMSSLLGDTLVEMALALIRNAGVEKESVVSAVLAGNTTMQHIALGIDPTPIGAAPFTPPTLFGDVREYAPFAKAGIAAGRVFLAPCVAAYVGGDITAGMLACGVLSKDEPLLFLDLGTNGEMALGDRNGIVSCATAAGPVFEGANIKYGMPAYPGAIARVVCSGDGRLELNVIDDCEPIGICGTGLFDVCALLLECGIIDEAGRIVDDDEIDPELSRGLERWLCEEDGQPAFELTPRVRVTQKDVRNLQLAKASVCAGVLTLMEYRGLGMEDVKHVLIAGGFGRFLDLDAAARVGVFPRELRAVAQSVGNTAIAGASDALVSSDARRALGQIERACDYIELSTSAKFNEFYVDQMEFA